MEPASGEAQALVNINLKLLRTKVYGEESGGCCLWIPWVTIYDFTSHNYDDLNKNRQTRSLVSVALQSMANDKYKNARLLFLFHQNP